MKRVEFFKDGKPRRMLDIERDIANALSGTPDEQIHFEWLTFRCNDRAVWPYDQGPYFWKVTVFRGADEGWHVMASCEGVHLDVKHLGRTPFRVAEALFRLLSRYP
jgi:hypothetical protein